MSTERRWLFLVLLLSLVLNLVPIWWGLPNYDGWAFDEIRPSVVLRGLKRHFSGGWATAYPPLHYYLLSVFFWPALAADAAGLIRLAPIELTTLLYLIGRLLSVVLATATVYLIYRCSRLLDSRPTAVLAALVGALIVPSVFYAKTVNLETPYLFWFVLSLFFFLKILRRHELRDYVLFAAAATFSVCTKDQAIGLYVLSPLVLMVALYRYRRREEPGVSFFKVISDRRVVLSALLAVALFVLIHNWAFNYHGFERHLRIIIHRSPSLFKVYAPTLAGHLAMAGQSLRHIAFAMGAPLALAALAGIIGAFRERRRKTHLLSLLLFGFSYYAVFISVTRHNYVRFLLPICLLLAFFAAAGLADFVRWRRLPRPLAIATVAAALVFCLLRTVSVDLLLLGDSRYRVEAWLRDNVRAGEQVVAFGRQNMLPRGVQLVPWRRIHRHGFGVAAQLGADLVVVSTDDLWKERERAFYRALESGELGYQRVLLHRSVPLFNLLDTEGIFTNLDKLNPEIAVFRRGAGSGPAAPQQGGELPARRALPSRDSPEL